MSIGIISIKNTVRYLSILFDCLPQTSVTHRISYESWLASRGLMLSPFHLRWQTTMFNRLFAYCARINPRALYLWWGLMLSSTTYSVPASSLYFSSVSRSCSCSLYIFRTSINAKSTQVTSFDWFPVVKETFAVKITLVEKSLRD